MGSRGVVGLCIDRVLNEGVAAFDREYLFGLSSGFGRCHDADPVAIPTDVGDRRDLFGAVFGETKVVREPATHPAQGSNRLTSKTTGFSPRSGLPLRLRPGVLDYHTCLEVAGAELL